MEIKNREVVVTGTSRGIGKAFAEALATRGARLHLVNRNPQADWLDYFKNKGAPAVTNWQADLSNPESINNFVTAFTRSGTPPEILINNSGILTGGQLETQDLKKIYELYQINLTAVTHLTHAFLPLMLKKNCGKIVNNASMSGEIYLPCNSTYAASKAGVIAFTNCLRQELRGTRVTTLLLVTPAVETEMYAQIPDLFLKNFKRYKMSGITASSWAQTVCKAIESDSPICEPKGTRGLAVFMAKHAPALVEKYVGSHFKRI